MPLVTSKQIQKSVMEHISNICFVAHTHALRQSPESANCSLAYAAAVAAAVELFVVLFIVWQ